MDRPHRDQQGFAYEAGTPGPWPPSSPGKVPSGPAGAGKAVGGPGTFLPGDAVDRLGRIGERQLREGDQVAVHLERVQIDVVEGVARQVVAGVELLLGRTAPDGLLSLGLDLLGPGEQAPRGDARLDERLIVAAPVNALSS